VWVLVVDFVAVTSSIFVWRRKKKKKKKRTDYQSLNDANVFTRRLCLALVDMCNYGDFSTSFCEEWSACSRARFKSA
jgi:hypothetical protein